MLFYCIFAAFLLYIRCFLNLHSAKFQFHNLFVDGIESNPGQ